MLTCEVVLIISLLALSYANYGHINPQIEVFTPKGFRISIEDQPGLARVEYHVNIKKGDQQKDFFKNVLRQRDGRWAFTQRKVRVEIGSEISYWLLAVKNGRADRVEGDSFFVKEHLNFHKLSDLRKTQSASSLGKTEASTAPTEPLSNCDKLIVNASQALASLHLEVQALTKMNQQLKAAIEKYPDAKKLTLSGRIPPDDEAMMTVTFILREKLDLQPKIVSAVKNRDNSITFEVATLFDKLEILDMAKYKLMYSKIFIF